MKIPLYQVDAFARKMFEGNPAAVCPLETWLPDEKLQKIALENNLSETAFFVKDEQPLRIRWFTPTVEVDLCGHATLATAHVLSKHMEYDHEVIEFESKSGKLPVTVNPTDYTLNFPSDQITELAPDHPVTEFFNKKPVCVCKGKTDYILSFENEMDIWTIEADFVNLAKFDGRGVIVTSRSNTYDFVSRCFYPQTGVIEDPATGSAHTTLAVFWSKKLSKTEFTAKQISHRGGYFRLRLEGDRVFITGKALTYLVGLCQI